jgi:methyl-accepting chemotaxis protein
VPASSDRAGNGTVEIKKKDLQELLDALRAARDGEVGVRIAPQKSGVMGDVAKVFNSLAERREGLTNELNRVSRVIGREGRLNERAQLKNVKGSWSESISAVNSMINDLVRPTIEVSRVLDAVADGDLSQKMSLKIEGLPVRGEFLRIGTTVNTMLDQLSSFAAEVTRVAREVGTEGILGGQARV